MSRALRLRVFAVVCGVFATGALGSSCVAAQAAVAVKHQALSQLTGFTTPTAMAFDAAGDLYVVDAGAKTVDRFTSAGVPLAFSASGGYIAGSKLTGAPTGPGSSVVPFESPRSVAVNDENGDIYVSDNVEHVVDVFSASGQYLSQLTGSPRGPFIGPTGLTVDQATHNLYVEDAAPENLAFVDVFESAGGYLFQLEGEIPDRGPLLGGTQSIGVNEMTGDAYVGEAQRAAVVVFEQLGNFASVWRGGGTPRTFSENAGKVYVAVDQSNGHVYVVATNVPGVDEFGSSVSEEYLGQITETSSGGFSSPDAVAVSPSNGDVYVADESGVVDIFGPDVDSPEVVTTPASGVGSTEATLTASINPLGSPVTACEFEYGLTTAYGHSAPCEQTSAQIGSGSASVPVTVTVSGLQQATGYHYRLKAANANLPITSGDQAFTTAGPPKISGEASESIGRTSATLTAHLDPSGLETKYHFEYGPTTAYGTSIPVPDASSPAAFAEEALSVNVTGLAIGETYHWRLVASNADSATPVNGSDQSFTTVPALGLEDENATQVLSTSATLEAQINPLGSDTHYYFQYGTSSCTVNPSSCTDSPALPGTDIGAGESTQVAGTELKSLTPSTLYYYRVIATNAFGTLAGPDATFTTPTAAGQVPGTGQSEGCANEQLRAEQPYGLRLPDCRAYEMVSPLDKNDNDAVNGKGEEEARASVTGEGIAYGVEALYAEPESGRLTNTYLSQRKPDGWSTKSLATPVLPEEDISGAGGLAPFYESAFTPDLSAGILALQNLPLNEEAPKGFNESYLEDLTNGSYQLISKNPEDGKGLEDTGIPYEWRDQETVHPDLVGESSDLSHVLYDPRATELSTVDEWTDGKAFLVSVENDGKSIQAFAGSGPPPRTEGEAVPAGTESAGANGEANFFHDVSSNGSRIYMTEGQQQYEGPNAFLGELLLRENAEQEQSPVENGKCIVPADACTVKVSESQRSEPDLTDLNKFTPPYFWGASADGSKAFFTSRAELTNNAFTGPKDNAANLYEYDVESGKLNDLSVDTTDPQGAGVLGVVQISEDGSYVYFVAEGILTAGEKNAAGQEPVAGGGNLYVAHDGDAPKFIALLENISKAQGTPGLDNQLPGDDPVWRGDQTVNEAMVSEDGTLLAFESERSLTGYDNERAQPGECEEAKETGRCREIYLYDATTGGLVCASCNPSGSRPIGASTLNSQRSAVQPVAKPRNFSEDGSRLFFDSKDALVPHDDNGRQDVYEYEDGHIYAISDVAGNAPSSFLDASGSGDDVFIATADQLVPADTDFHVDVYDVRVGGGFPVSVPSPACDNGDSCKGPVSPQPGVFGAPASATFSGAGNLAPVVAVAPAKKAMKKAVKCKRGLVKNKQSKCVKRKKTKVKKSAHTNRRPSR